MKNTFLIFTIAGSLAFAASDLQAQNAVVPSLLIYKQDIPLVLNENPQSFVKVNYRYDKDGRLIGAAGKGDFKIDDGFGNISHGIINQVYKIIGGQAKLFQNDTDTNTKYLDGAKSKQNITVQYRYDEQGRLQSASGNGKLTGDDGFGNKTESKISQTFLLLQGQAKLKASKQESLTKNTDGSSKKQDLTVAYRYDSKGKMAGASGNGTVITDDGFGNVKTEKIAQKYPINNGQIKQMVKKSVPPVVKSAITAFSPQRGKPGTVVMIKGNNLDQVNDVFFGCSAQEIGRKKSCLKGTMTARSRTRLTVIVPQIKANQPIHVYDKKAGFVATKDIFQIVQPPAQIVKKPGREIKPARGRSRKFAADPASINRFPAPPAREEQKTATEEPEVVRNEPQPEAEVVQCDRGTWSPTLRTCIEDQAPEEAAPPDCGAGAHWSPTLKSCQPD